MFEMITTDGLILGTASALGGALFTLLAGVVRDNIARSLDQMLATRSISNHLKNINRHYHANLRNLEKIETEPAHRSNAHLNMFRYYSSVVAPFELSDLQYLNDATAERLFNFFLFVRNHDFLIDQITDQNLDSDTTDKYIIELRKRFERTLRYSKNLAAELKLRNADTFVLAES